MSDLIEFGRELVKNNLPELIPLTFGLGAKLSKLVFALRVEKGWTQNDLAEKIHVEPRLIYKMEGGSKDITIGQYEDALRVLGLTYEEMDNVVKY